MEPILFQDYETALGWIHNCPRGFKRSGGLDRMRWLLAALGNPEQNVRAIHVAGTNGKGSTTVSIRDALQTHGLRVATFTSPHIERFNERIAINGAPIADDDLVVLANRVVPVIQEGVAQGYGWPTEFEVITAIAFCYFAWQQPDVVVLEVGIGGLSDCTNVVVPIVSVITTIGLDHVPMLGATLAEIAAQKAGIIKRGVPVVVGSLAPEAAEVVQQQALAQHAPLYCLGTDFFIDNESHDSEGRYAFDFRNRSVCYPVQLALRGYHQMANAATALQAAAIYLQATQQPLEWETMIAALQHTFWQGRMECVATQPAIYLDGAHNEEGMRSVVHTLQHAFKDRRVTVLFAALAHKEYQAMFQQLAKATNSRLTVTTFDFFNAASIDMLTAEAPQLATAPSWQQFVDQFQQQAAADEVLLVTGSLYFISEVRQYLMTKKQPRHV